MATAVGAGMVATFGAQLIWTRGFTKYEEQIEENRKYWSSFVEEFPPKPVAIAGVMALGGIHGAGYAAARPLLPRQPIAAGAVYGAATYFSAFGANHLVRRHYGLREPPPRLLSLRELAGHVLHGAAIGWLASRASC